MLKISVADAYTLVDDSDGESEQDEMSSSSESCKECLLCCYKLLLKLNLLTDAYKRIRLACKLLLTLPVPQVACERSFSALKRIKNRLSTMTQEHLEEFMLMSVQKRILAKLDTKNIIDGVGARSSELRRPLLS